MSNNIKKIAEALNIDFNDLAALSGYSVPNLYSISSRAELNKTHIDKFSSVFRCEKSDLTMDNFDSEAFKRKIYGGTAKTEVVAPGNYQKLNTLFAKKIISFFIQIIQENSITIPEEEKMEIILKLYFSLSKNFNQDNITINDARIAFDIIYSI